MTKGKTVVLLFLLLVSSVTYGSGAPQTTLRPPDTTIPIQLFGLHIHHMLTGTAEKTPWPSIPFGSWRLLAAYADWPNLEPKRGQWDFRTLDKYVEVAQNHDVEVMLPLVFSPAWASARPIERSSYSPGNAAAPKNLAEWQNYVRTVATRYKGRIHEYEIWNEPNVKTIYSGSIPEMVRLAGVAYQTLKKVDPTIIVCSPSATRTSGVDWLDQYLKAGGGKYADVIGFHFYVDPEAPEQMVPLIQQVEQVMRTGGAGDKPLWDTETGYMIQNKQSVVKAPPHTPYLVLSESQAVSYLARTYILAWASGVSRLYWYAWDNWSEGLVDRDGKTLKAPAIAYGELEKWLVGARMDSCSTDAAGTWTCTITRPGGYRGWIVWNPTATKQLIKFPIPLAWHVTRVRDLLGHVSRLAPGATFDVSIMPHLLEAPGR